MLDDLESEMKNAFLSEARTLLEDAENAFMALDAGDRSEELINRIFRLAHNLKSSAKTVGFQQLSDFAHVFEDALTQVKQGKIEPSPAVCTVLLKTLDAFKDFIDTSGASAFP